VPVRHVEIHARVVFTGDRGMREKKFGTEGRRGPELAIDDTLSRLFSKIKNKIGAAAGRYGDRFQPGLRPALADIVRATEIGKPVDGREVVLNERGTLRCGTALRGRFVSSV